MSTPSDTVQTRLTQAMKARDRERVAVLRMLLADLQNERIKTGQALDEAGYFAIVQRGIKQRKEAAEQFRSGRRDELAAKEEREAELLGELLPKAADEGELRQAITALLDAEGLSGPSAIGRVMKELLPRFAGRTDGATLNRLAREVLAGRG